MYDYYDKNSYHRAAQTVHLPAPTMSCLSEVKEADTRIISGILSSGRKGVYYGITFTSEADTLRFTVKGVRLLDRQESNDRLVMFLGIGNQSTPFQLVVGSEPVKVTLYEVSSLSGIPEAAAVLSRRPLHSVPTHTGDYAEVGKRRTFGSGVFTTTNV